MAFKAMLKRSRVAVTAHRAAVGLLSARSTARELRRLEESGQPHTDTLARALRALQRPETDSERKWSRRIEAERTRLLADERPLDDGSLPDSPLSDGALTIPDVCRASKPPKPARLLFLITRAFGPERVIELGTNVGLSSAYIAAALQAGGGEGRIVTLDGSAYRQRLARDVHRNLELKNVTCVEGLFTDTLRPTLTELERVDMAFIDGHHQYQPTLDYFEEVLAFATPDTVFVFDDIRWSDGMRKAWKRIQSDERLGLVVDLQSVGICLQRHTSSQRFVSDPIRLF